MTLGLGTLLTVNVIALVPKYVVKVVGDRQLA